MQLAKLSREDMIKIYEEMMVLDFPESERKPLSMILDAMEKGGYECLGLQEQDMVLGYALLSKLQEDYLLDYFAVKNDCRDSGVGSAFLQLLREYFSEANSIIGEVENPDCAETEAERDVRIRRRSFYKRNGFVDTGIELRLFGVDFMVIEFLLDRKHTREEIKQLINAHYKAMLPPEKFETKVQIL